jgi:UDP-glucose 4-epimerase
VKIVVTGGLGYIGSHTVVALHEAGYIPIIIDNLSNTSIEVLAGLKEIIGYAPDFYQDDCLDVDAMDKVFRENPEVAGIIHFAAYKAVGESVEQPLMYYRNNVQSLVVMAEIALKHGVANFVFSSSCTVYGQPDELPVTEQSPVKQAESPYGYTKQIGERILLDLSEVSPLKPTLLRYFNPVGAHPSAKIGELPIGVPNNLVPFIAQTAAGLREELVVFGNDYNTPDGTCVRDYIHVCDIAAAHVLALDKMAKPDSPKHITLNLGSGCGNTVLQVLNAFEKVNGFKVNYRIGNRREGDVEKVFANNNFAKEYLNWNTKYTLEDAMKHVWNWQKKLGV